MIKSTLPAVALIAIIATPAHAQLGGGDGTAGATGAQKRETFSTGPQSGNGGGWTYPTGPQSVQLPRTSTGGLAPVFGGYDGLPPTRLDSFVREAGGLAFQIYGDEGTSGPPPISGFNRVNRIDAGIQGNNAGLTTGHESVLPSAWGADEFIGGPEYSISGDHMMRNGQGAPAGYPLDPGDGLPGGTRGGGYYDPSMRVFPGADGP